MSALFAVGARLERVGRAADVDLLGVLGVGGRGEHVAHRGDRPRVARARRPRSGWPSKPRWRFAAAKPTRTERSISGASAAGRRIPTTVNQRPAEPHALARGHAVDAEPARPPARRARRPGRARSRRSGSGPCATVAPTAGSRSTGRPPATCDAAGLGSTGSAGCGTPTRRQRRGRGHPLDRRGSGRSSPAPTPAAPPSRRSALSRSRRSAGSCRARSISRQQPGLAGRRDAEHRDHRARRRSRSRAPRAPRAARRVRRPTLATRGEVGGAQPARDEIAHAGLPSATIRPSRTSTRRGSSRRELGVVGDRPRPSRRRDGGPAAARGSRRPRRCRGCRSARRRARSPAADERPRDRHPLALAAGELRRPVHRPVREPDAIERLGRPRPPLGLRRRRRRAGRRRRCRAPSSARRRWNCWKTKPIRPARSAASSAVRQRRDVEAGDRDAARRRAVQRAHQVQQRRLPRARRADDRDELAGQHRERHAPQGLHRRLARIGLRGPLELEHRRAHEVAGTTTRSPPRSAPVTCTRPFASSNRPSWTGTSRRFPAAPATSTA